MSQREDDLQFPNLDEFNGPEPELRRCILCENGYDRREERGHSAYACDQHPKCEGKHGSCSESVHPQSQGNHCAWCEVESNREYLQHLQAKRPNPLTNEALQDEAEAWIELFRSQGVLEALEADMAVRRRRRISRARKGSVAA